MYQLIRPFFVKPQLLLSEIKDSLRFRDLQVISVRFEKRILVAFTNRSVDSGGKKPFKVIFVNCNDVLRHELWLLQALVHYSAMVPKTVFFDVLQNPLELLRGDFRMPFLDFFNHVFHGQRPIMMPKSLQELAQLFVGHAKHPPCKKE